MKLAAADFLGFSDLAETWASEPGNRSYDYIIAKLLTAYWLGSFEKLHDSVPDYWPVYEDTYWILRYCGGLPQEALPAEDGGNPNWEGLARVPFNDYSVVGKAILDGVELPRDMIRLWCLDQGYEPPHHWIPNNDENTASYH